MIKYDLSKEQEEEVEAVRDNISSFLSRPKGSDLTELIEIQNQAVRGVPEFKVCLACGSKMVKTKNLGWQCSVLARDNNWELEKPEEEMREIYIDE